MFQLSLFLPVSGTALSVRILTDIDIIVMPMI